VHIRFFGNGGLWFRSYSGSLWKSPKVTKGLLPHHSAPRLGSVCPNAGLNPWAAVMGHPWPRTANPASCRVTHGFKPAFGQRGFTGRLRSRSKARARGQSKNRMRSCKRASDLAPLSGMIGTHPPRQLSKTLAGGLAPSSRGCIRMAARASRLRQGTRPGQAPD